MSKQELIERAEAFHKRLRRTGSGVMISNVRGRQKPKPKKKPKK